MYYVHICTYVIKFKRTNEVRFNSFRIFSPNESKQTLNRSRHTNGTPFSSNSHRARIIETRPTNPHTLHIRMYVHNVATKIETELKFRTSRVESNYTTPSMHILYNIIQFVYVGERLKCQRHELDSALWLSTRSLTLCALNTDAMAKRHQPLFPRLTLAFLA